MITGDYNGVEFNKYKIDCKNVSDKISSIVKVSNKIVFLLHTNGNLSIIYTPLFTI